MRIEEYSQIKWEKYVPKTKEYKDMVEDLESKGLNVVILPDKGLSGAIYESIFGSKDELEGSFFLNNPADYKNISALDCFMSAPEGTFPNIIQVYQKDPIFTANEINFITELYTEHSAAYKLCKKFINNLKKYGWLVIEPYFVKTFETNKILLRPEGLNGSNYVKQGLASYPENKFSELCGKALTYDELEIVQSYLIEKRFSTDHAQELFYKHEFLFKLKFF